MLLLWRCGIRRKPFWDVGGGVIGCEASRGPRGNCLGQPFLQGAWNSSNNKQKNLGGPISGTNTVEVAVQPRMRGEASFSEGLEGSEIFLGGKEKLRLDRQKMK